MTLYLREGGYYLRADGDVVGPCVAGPNCDYPWRIGCVYYQDDGTNDLGPKMHLTAEVEKPDREIDRVYVRWGSYAMSFANCTMEEAVRRFAARVPLREKTTVVANYSWNEERVWQLTVEPETIYHVGQLRGVE